jgi:hypothetical protein
VGEAKKIILRTISSQIANRFVKRYHYSKKVVPNSNLHIGCFLKNELHGVLSFGPSINKKGTKNLVKGTKWNEFIELNRMAFDEILPKNSESRCIAIAIKLIKRNAPHIKWIVSFADGTSSGDGCIYRACGFKLVGITKNTALRKNPITGKVIHIIQAHHLKISKEFRTWQPLEGVQFKYVYLIDKKSQLNVPIIPFKKIKELGLEMYKGKKIIRNNANIV